MPSDTTASTSPDAYGPVLLIGDSVAAGLGARGRSYGALVAEALGTELVDRSEIGWTVADSLRAWREDPVPRARLAVIAHGITEPLIRLTPETMRILPFRWRKTAWMDPRPYYSSDRRQALAQRVESEVRWRVKNALLRAGRGHQLMTVDAYVEALASLTADVATRADQVLVIGPPPVAERFFPGTSSEQERYWDAAKPHLDASILELRGKLDEWDDFLLDRFHPSAGGHQKIAQLVLSAAAIEPHRR